VNPYSRALIKIALAMNGAHSPSLQEKKRRAMQQPARPSMLRTLGLAGTVGGLGLALASHEAHNKQVHDYLANSLQQQIAGGLSAKMRQLMAAAQKDPHLRPEQLEKFMADSNAVLQAVNAHQLKDLVSPGLGAYLPSALADPRFRYAGYGLAGVGLAALLGSMLAGR
jgi:hypothetical protein